MLPLLLNRLESQEVVVYTYAAVVLDRILSMRTGGSMTPMYAFPPIASSSSSNFVGSHPWTYDRSRLSMTSPPRSESRTARSAQNHFLMHCACAFRALVLCLISRLSRCCKSYHRGEAGPCRGVRHCLAQTRRHPQSCSKPE